MLNSTYRSAQNLIFSHNPLVRRATMALLLASGALLIALFIGIVGPLLALAAAIAIVGLVLILDDTHWGFVALAGVIFVLPFASLPFSIGFKPTFLDVALGALFFVWVFKLVTGQEEEFIASPLGLLVRPLHVDDGLQLCQRPDPQRGQQLLHPPFHGAAAGHQPLLRGHQHRAHQGRSRSG